MLGTCLLRPQFINAVPKSKKTWCIYIAGISAYLFQVTMTMGLRRMKAAPSAAISYLSVVWGALAGVLIFNEYPTSLEIAGAAVICCATMAVVASEGWQQRRQQANARAQLDIESGTNDDEEVQLLAVELATGNGAVQAEGRYNAAVNG